MLFVGAQLQYLSAEPAVMVQFQVISLPPLYI